MQKIKTNIHADMQNFVLILLKRQKSKVSHLRDFTYPMLSNIKFISKSHPNF